MLSGVSPTRRSCRLGAANTAKIAASLYPQSDTANGYYAISLILIGKTGEARESLKRAAAISSRGIASATAVNQIGLAIARAGKLKAAIDWAKVASEIYPKEAPIYGSLGGFYLKQDKRELAIEAYKKALEIDANFQHAKKKLQELSK